MTESKRKAQTPYGDVDFDTRTCASCEQEYLPEDTFTVYLGDGKGRYKNTYDVKITFNRGSLKELYFCKNCVKRPLQVKMKDPLKNYRKYLTEANIIRGFMFAVLIVCLTMMGWHLL